MKNVVALHGTAFVTGAGSGIGRQIALELGAHVPVACADRDPAAAHDTVERLRESGARAVAVDVDVADRASVGDAVAVAQSALGPLRYAVNAAGINIDPVATVDLTAASWDRVLGVNLTGILFSVQAEGEAMLADGGGSIVNIASMSGTIVNRGMDQTAYVSSKAGVIHLTRSVAAEWAPRGIRVNALSPGYTMTQMNAEKDRALLEAMSDQVPLGRFASTHEIAAPCLFLLSDAAGYITGFDLRVDGGHGVW